MTDSIPLNLTSGLPSLKGQDYRFPYPCLFSETCAIMPSTGQDGYKKRKLSEVNPGKCGRQTGF